MASTKLEEILRVFEASLSKIKWRLKTSSKRRLQTDTLALCTGMRPVIMVDYGGKMPELGDRLCAFLEHCKHQSLYFELVRPMVIGDMIYLIQFRSLANFATSSLNLETGLLLVDLENDPPKMNTLSEKTPTLMELISVQELFSTVFNEHLVTSDQLQRQCTDDAASSFGLIDLSYCLQKCQTTIPTLNGWLLGYPVVYLFGNDFIEQAIRSLSTTSLHLYQVFVNRVGASSKESGREELMSFTVPYELSMDGINEPWAKSFLGLMHEKLSKCNQVWDTLHLEVSSCSPQPIAL